MLCSQNHIDVAFVRKEQGCDGEADDLLGGIPGKKISVLLANFSKFDR